MKLTPCRVFTRYDEIASSAETNHFCLALARILALRVRAASPLRDKVLLDIEEKNMYGLASMELRYEDLDPHDAFVYQQIRSLFSSRADLEFEGHDKSATALAKFNQAESLCRETNDIFRLRSDNLFCFRPRVESVLFRAQRKIAQILGDVPSLHELTLRFGPGSTTSIKKAESCPRNKLGLKPACSKNLAPMADLVKAEMPGWFARSPEGDLPERAPSSYPASPEAVGIVEFVPKNYKNHRAIAKEPDLNVILQAGIGDFMVHRLSMFGCDLRTGQDRNKSMARAGSLSGALATLDLSSASDTVATSLVFDLLPFEWAVFLDGARTSRVDLFGSVFEQEKFSSMGNGFTFPLETLIFFSIAQSCSDTVSVFGDDIIVETGAVELLVEVLTACGFLVNTSKSFTSGPFRESCGGDYFLGIDIRPCFLKNRLSAASLFTLHNFFARRYDEEVTKLCTKHLSHDMVLYGPDGYGDGHLIGDWTPKHPNVRRGFGGVSFSTYQLTGRNSIRVSHGDYVLPSYSVYVSGKRDPLVSNPGGNSSRSYFQASPSRVRLSLSERTRLDFIEAPLSVARYDRRAHLQVGLPGTKGYKRIEIYTFQRP